MGTTTFTGPIRAGNILNTTGMTPGTNVANVGQVVMAQSAAVSEDPEVFTTISIPAYSQVLSIDFAVTVDFDNSVSVGNTIDGETVDDPEYFSDPTALTMGIVNVSTTTLDQVNNRLNVGYPDSQVVIAGGAAAGAGRGVITIMYLQGPNGNV